MKKNKKQRVTIFIDPKLLKQAKAQAIADDLTLTVLTERALEKYLPKETILKQD